MSHCYLICSHQHPEQVYRLVRRIRSLSPTSRIVVSHDRKGPPLSMERLASSSAELLSTPTPVYWGDASFLDAILAALRHIGPGIPGDWVTVLTGQDYPIARLLDYEAFLESSGADMLLEETAGSAGIEALHRRSLVRVLRVPGFVRRRRQLLRVVAGVVRRAPGLEWMEVPPGVPEAVLVPRRRTPFGPDLTPHKGADQFALGHRALLALLGADPRLLAYFRSTRIPSEAYVHTVLLNDTDLVNEAGMLHHTVWGASAHPELLDEVPAEELMARRPFWFARKFSPNAAVLDDLDRLLDGRDR